MTAMTDRVQRNLELAQKYYRAYAHGVERGHIDFWSDEDWAEEATIFHPRLGERVRSASDSGKVTPADATDEMNLIWKGIPDFHADNFEPFPTEHGCAWRVRYSGHTLDGEFVAQWEGGFIWTDEDGRITRYEFYEDYDHHDKIIQAVVGTSSAEFDFEKYGQQIEENRKA
jgi:ketosteroid isomerase-like protein